MNIVNILVLAGMSLAGLVVIGLILAIIPITLIPHINLTPLIYIISIWGIFTIIFYLIGKVWTLYKDKINLSIISAHLFDASSTFIAVDYFGYYDSSKDGTCCVAYD